MRFFLILLLCRAALHGDIVESQDIRDLLRYADEDTLVVLDLNNVLMETSQLLGSDQWADFEIKNQMKEKKLTKEEVLDTFVPEWHKILMASAVKPVEETTVGVIRRLQKRKIKLIGLTARYIEMAYPTHDQLRSIGINLARSTVHSTDREIPGPFAAKFIEGIIFVGLKNEKGLTLFRFLDLIGYQPKKILFIDDRLKNLQSVEAAATARGVPFKGIRYGYLDESEKQHNPAISEMQKKYLNCILPDHLVQLLLTCPEKCVKSKEEL